MHGYLKEWPEWIQTLVHINHFALVVNSSINILIYACKDEKFLNVLLESGRQITPKQFSQTPTEGGRIIFLVLKYAVLDNLLGFQGRNKTWTYQVQTFFFAARGSP